MSFCLKKKEKLISSFYFTYENAIFPLVYIIEIISMGRVLIVIKELTRNIYSYRFPDIRIATKFARSLDFNEFIRGILNEMEQGKMN